MELLVEGQEVAVHLQKLVILLQHLADPLAARHHLGLRICQVPACRMA